MDPTWVPWPSLSSWRGSEASWAGQDENWPAWQEGGLGSFQGLREVLQVVHPLAACRWLRGAEGQEPVGSPRRSSST